MTAVVLVGLVLWLAGLCVGSFLNVVIHRLPRGASISSPRWSFCPHCRATIHWYDNIPVLSWLLLGARCRECRAVISAQYPLVEALTGFAFVFTYHLLWLGECREGLTGGPAWPVDIPLLLAWLLLVAVLIACSGMDLVAYLVDTRLTDLALLAGLVTHVAWPRPEFLIPPVEGPLGGAAVAAFIASGLMLWLTVWRAVPTEDTRIGEPSAMLEPPPELSVAEARRTLVRGWVAGLVFCGLAVGLLAVAGLEVGDQARWSGVLVPLGFTAIFAATVLAAGQPRAVDHAVHAAIEEERPQARAMVLRELWWLRYIVLSALVVYLLLAFVPDARAAWRAAVNWSPGGFVPLAGAAFAMHGAMLAAAAGWAVRLLFTLIFGREAFATGDIFILAAAGAAVGWDIALLGFLLAVLIATAGWGVGLLLKRTGMIPFGPWLTIGFLAALWLNRPAAELARGLYDSLELATRQRPELLWMLGGLMFVGLAAAVSVARLVRRVVESPGGGLGDGPGLAHQAAIGFHRVREDPMNLRPIAVFDSGLGGLSVVRHLRELLAAEEIVYFGDTARVPYGTKSRQTVTQFALESARFLLEFEPKLIVAACNTASALAIDELRRELPVPVIGVVEPGARAAVEHAGGGPVGVIATEATIASEAYPAAIHRMDPALVVLTQACPLFVPLVEEGRGCDDPIVRLVVETYLGPLRAQGVRVLVLGCTHYPLLRGAIAEFLGEGTYIVDSGRETSLAVQRTLGEADALCRVQRVATMRCYVSDNPARFRRVGSRFLNHEIEHVEFVAPERYIASAAAVAAR